MDIAAQIVAIRDERSLSLRELAKASGMPHSRISKIEQGHVKPSFKDVIRLASGLSLPEEVRAKWLEQLSSEILQVS